MFNKCFQYIIFKKVLSIYLINYASRVTWDYIPTSNPITSILKVLLKKNTWTQPQVCMETM